MASNEITMVAELLHSVVRLFIILRGKLLFHLKQFTCPKRVFANCS